MKTKQPVSDDIRRQIELRAYFIWEREGYPDGREAEHWAQAEAEILSEQPVKKAIEPEASTPQKAVAAKPAAKKTPGESTKAAAKTVKPKPAKTRSAKTPN